jgi:hypothetical protein
MRIALNFEKLSHRNAARLADSTDIVTPQIKEHGVFSTLFLVSQQTRGKFSVHSRIRVPWARAGDGVDRDFAM